MGWANLRMLGVARQSFKNQYPRYFITSSYSYMKYFAPCSILPREYIEQGYFVAYTIYHNG